MSASDKNRGLGPADRAATAPRPEEFVDDGGVRGAGLRSRSAAVQGSDSTSPGTCDTIETTLEEVAFRGQEPAGDLREHLASCQQCADRFKREAALYRIPPELKPRVFEELARQGASGDSPGSLRRDQVGKASTKFAWLGQHSRPLVAVGAGALTVALVLAFGDVMILSAGTLHQASRIPVVVADASNDTGDSELEGLSELFIASLQESQLLAPLSRQQMLETLARPERSEAKRIDEALGRDVARQTQARALLLISIRRYDRVYVIDVRAVDPSSDRYLFALREEGTDKSSIPGMIDRLSDRVRRLMREGRQSTVRKAGDPPAGPAAR